MFLYVHCLVHRNLLFEMMTCYFALYSNHPQCSKYLITTSLSQSVKISISLVLVIGPRSYCCCCGYLFCLVWFLSSDECLACVDPPQEQNRQTNKHTETKRSTPLKVVVFRPRNWLKRVLCTITVSPSMVYRFNRDNNNNISLQFLRFTRLHLPAGSQSQSWRASQFTCRNYLI